MLWLAPAGLRGGLKLEAYHQSRQPHSLSVALNVLFALPKALRRHSSQLLRQRQSGFYRHRGVLFPGSAIRDGCTHVLGLRIIVPEALRRPSGQLLWQRQCSPPQTLRRLFRQLLRQRQSLVDLSILALISRYLLCSFTRSVREFFAWAALYGRCGVPSADC